jgi:hypothetical protein
VEGLCEKLGQFDREGPLLRGIQAGVCLNDDERHVAKAPVCEKAAMRATEQFTTACFKWPAGIKYNHKPITHVHLFALDHKVSFM